jgi:hypothetical protein
VATFARPFCDPTLHQAFFSADAQQPLVVCAQENVEPKAFRMSPRSRLRKVRS